MTRPSAILDAILIICVITGLIIFAADMILSADAQDELASCRASLSVAIEGRGE